MKASYERGVLDTKEVAVVCKDYYTESWGVAMDRAGVPANFELRKVENIFLPRRFFLPRLPSLTLTLSGGKKRTRKLNNRRRTSHPKTSSRLETSSYRLRRLNQSPELKALALRLLTPRKTWLRIKSRFLDVGFSFIISLLFFISVAFATICNTNYL